MRHELCAMRNVLCVMHTIIIKSKSKTYFKLYNLNNPKSVYFHMPEQLFPGKASFFQYPLFIYIFLLFKQKVLNFDMLNLKKVEREEENIINKTLYKIHMGCYNYTSNLVKIYGHVIHTILCMSSAKCILTPCPTLCLFD